MNEPHVFAPPAIVRHVDQMLMAIDARVDRAEDDGIHARWEFGRELLKERIGKQLPAGRLAELAERTGKSKEELSARVRFAERFPTEAEVCNAVTDFSSWHRIVNEGLPGTVAVLGSSDSEEWYTPAKYVEAARDVLGHIDLDPASCDAANEVVKADRFYTVDDDGLTQPWKGRVFMNPPFGRDGSPLFVAKLLAEYKANNVTAAVLVCAARLETDWFQPLFNHTLCFPDHRVKFWQPGRDPAPPFTPVFVYLGYKPDAFLIQFANFGPIVRRVG